MSQKGIIPSLEDELANDLIKFKSDKEGFKYKSLPGGEDFFETLYLKDNYFALYLSIKYELAPGVALRLMGINNSLSLAELKEFERVNRELGDLY